MSFFSNLSLNNCPEYNTISSLSKSCISKTDDNPFDFIDHNNIRDIYKLPQKDKIYRNNFKRKQSKEIANAINKEKNSNKPQIVPKSSLDKNLNSKKNIALIENALDNNMEYKQYENCNITANVINEDNGIVTVEIIQEKQ